MQRVLTLFALNLVLTHSPNFFIATKRISDWHHFLQVKVSVVNSAGGSFCWNYETDTLYSNYAGDNVCCIYANFEVVLFVILFWGGSGKERVWPCDPLFNDEYYRYLIKTDDFHLTYTTEAQTFIKLQV